VFHMDVAKVDRELHMLQVFQRHVAGVSNARDGK
jgi:hypothetical protein